jgi:hypothetical protein
MSCAEQADLEQQGAPGAAMRRTHAEMSAISWRLLPSRGVWVAQIRSGGCELAAALDPVN